jgi:aryl-alcohol dehydrogenase-like predicted oxidoreductase
LDVAGYIVPINKLWSLLSLSDALDVMKNIRKPIIAMKPLAQGILAHDLEGAFTFLFKKARITAVLVSVSSVAEAKQTSLALSKSARSIV